MKNLQCAGNAFRKIALITLAGFLVVVLSGPVLTVLGVLLPFALVGLLFYIPYRALRLSKEGGLPAVRDAAKKSLRVVLTPPIWLVSTVLGGVKRVLGFGFGTISFLLGLIFPTVAGVFLGALLGVFGGMEHNDADMRVPAGALIGGSIGFLAGVTRGGQSKRNRSFVDAKPQALSHA